jgi:hypothetical protein
VQTLLKLLAHIASPLNLRNRMCSFRGSGRMVAHPEVSSLTTLRRRC